MIGVLAVVGLGLIVCGFIGMAIGGTKGRRAAGFWLGVFLGPIGLVVMAAMSMTVQEELRRENLKAHLRQVQQRNQG